MKTKEEIDQKLERLQVFQDGAFPEYVAVLLENGNSKNEVISKLTVFLEDKTIDFVNWLFDDLESVSASQEETILNDSFMIGEKEGEEGEEEEEDIMSSQLKSQIGETSLTRNKNSANFVPPRLITVVFDEISKPSTVYKTKRVLEMERELRESKNKTPKPKSNPQEHNGNDNEKKEVTNRMKDFPKNRLNPSKQVACSFWPNCKNGSRCPFIHPVPCKVFPKCPHGSYCAYFHPPIPCKFGLLCTSESCNYTHPPPPPPQFNIPCKFGDECKNPECPYIHKKGNLKLVNKQDRIKCRDGPNCQNPQCTFQHYSKELE